MERSIADLTAGARPEASEVRRGDRLQRVQIGPTVLVHQQGLAGVFAAG